MDGPALRQAKERLKGVRSERERLLEEQRSVNLEIESVYEILRVMAANKMRSGPGEGFFEKRRLERARVAQLQADLVPIAMKYKATLPAINSLKEEIARLSNSPYTPTTEEIGMLRERLEGRYP